MPRSTAAVEPPRRAPGMHNERMRLTVTLLFTDIEGSTGPLAFSRDSDAQEPGLRPTPPYREFGRPAGRIPGSGRQAAIQTTPGSRISKPSKNRPISFTGLT